MPAAIAAVLMFVLPFSVAMAQQAITFQSVWLSDQQIAALKQKVDQKIEPQISAWPAVLAAADKALADAPHPMTVWNVPGFYEDPKGHAAGKDALKNDANGAYAAALAWRITGEAKYAQAAARNIMAWTRGVKEFKTKNDSKLSFSYHYPPMILAADLLRNYDGFSKSDRAEFADFLRTKALPMNCMDHDNNWGNWGLVLAVTSAAYLHDAELMKTCEKRWRDFIAEQIADDGHLIHEVDRNGGKGDYGLWYSHFSLLPQTIAAQVLKNNGLDLFDYKAPNGRTLELAYKRLAPWAEDPATFPYFKGADKTKLHVTDYASYFEILNAHWPDKSARKLMQRLRPMSATHGAPFLTFTHGEPLSNP